LEYVIVYYGQSENPLYQIYNETCAKYRNTNPFFKVIFTSKEMVFMPYVKIISGVSRLILLCLETSHSVL
jgi:hypothetical protein